MNNDLNNTALSTCRRCNRELSLEAFYINPRTNTSDCYCKECRRGISRKQHVTDKNKQNVNKTRKSPIIPLVEDRATRIALILNAQQVVNERIARKKRQDWERLDDE